MIDEFGLDFEVEKHILYLLRNAEKDQVLVLSELMLTVDDSGQIQLVRWYSERTSQGSSVSVKPTLSCSETIGNVKLTEIFSEIFPF